MKPPQSRMVYTRAATTLISLILGACTVGPVYEAPDIDTRGAWSLPDADGELDVDLATWWSEFDDPALARLIRLAQQNNLDLRQSLHRIVEARALRAGIAAGYAPVLDARGVVDRRRLSENGVLPVGDFSGIPQYQTVHDVGFDASWELDVFGRTRNRVLSADAEIDRISAESRDLLLAVTAEVARNYLELRGLQVELAARNRSIEAVAETLRLVKTQYRIGEVPIADVAVVETELATLRADIPRLESRTRVIALSLGAMLGQLPESELDILSQPASLVALRELPVGARADILRRRADVRAAESYLAAVSADVGVARAEWFPKFWIGASGGFESLASNSLLDNSSQTWSLIPSISWRVFDGGRIKAEISASEARVDQAALAYRETVIEALTEAEQGLSSYRFGLERLRLQDEAVDAASLSYRIATSQYQAGEISLLELLDAERSLRQAEQHYAVAHTEAATSLVSLFKALGGGWQPG